MSMLNWKKPTAKRGKDLFWGLPTGPGSRYPFNEEYPEEKEAKSNVFKLTEAKYVKKRKERAEADEIMKGDLE